MSSRKYQQQLGSSRLEIEIKYWLEIKIEEHVELIKRRGGVTKNWTHEREKKKCSERSTVTVGRADTLESKRSKIKIINLGPDMATTMVVGEEKVPFFLFVFFFVVFLSANDVVTRVAGI